MNMLNTCIQNDQVSSGKYGAAKTSWKCDKSVGTSNRTCDNDVSGTTTRQRGGHLSVYINEDVLDWPCQSLKLNPWWCHNAGYQEAPTHDIY